MSRVILWNFVNFFIFFIFIKNNNNKPSRVTLWLWHVSIWDCFI